MTVNKKSIRFFINQNMMLFFIVLSNKENNKKLTVG